MLTSLTTNHRPTPCRAACCAALALWLAPLTAGAQTVPDAGTILESNRAPALIAPARNGAKVVPDAAPLTASAPGGEQVLRVQRFALKGVSAIPESELQALLQPYVNRDVTLAELDQAARRIAAHYRARGYFLASSHILPQQVAQGELTIQVLEGRLSAVKVVPGAGVRLDPGVARRYVDALIAPGDAIDEAKLERAMLLIGDLPGIGARAELAPGANIGETALDIGLTEGPRVDGNVGFDNASNRYTGKYRLTGAVNINDLGGLGGQLSLLGMTSGADFNYLRAGYVMALGGHGTRVGASYSTLRYKLGAEFAALNASGDANVAQLIVMHPLIRSRYTNLMLTTGFDARRAPSRANGADTSDKSVRSLPLGLSLTRRDELFGGGSWNAAVDVTSGRVDLSANAVFQKGDAAGPRTEGRFTHVNYQLGRQQLLGANWAMQANLAGQFASKNLESGEKMSLGGPGRVRAYPAGEASGDQGYVLNLEARKQLPLWQSELAIFYDYGHVTVNRDAYAGAAVGAAASYALQGVGAGLTWRPAPNSFVQVQLATKLGSNPGRSADGKDVDGNSARTRAWLKLGQTF